MFESGFLSSLIGFFVVLTPLVFIHELGHYFAAVKSGVKVETFSVGFGPEIFGYTDKKNTRWKFSLIPLGGYVKMKGELIHVSKENEKKSYDKDAFLQASLFSRFFIVISGPLANLVLGVFLIVGLYYFHGRYVSPPIINEVIDSKPALQSGLMQGDKIITINEKKINDFFDIKKIVEANPNNSLIFEILRNNNIFKVKVITEGYNVTPTKIIGRIGITAVKPELKKLPILSSLQFGFQDTVKMTTEWLKGLKSLLVFEVNKQDVIGPIGIAKISGSSLETGFASIIFLMAILSINLGLINLLPIPALDGGYILLYAYELIFRKPLSGKIQTTLLKFGILFLIFLMVLVTLFDLGL